MSEGLKPVQLRREPVPEVLDRLRRLYTAAKAGKIRAFRYVTIEDDGPARGSAEASDLSDHEALLLDHGVFALAFQCQHRLFTSEVDVSFEDEPGEIDDDSP